MKKLKGFTLIELLVVITIITLLLAILIPSLQRSRKQAFLVACQSNLKQLGVILEMYTDKSDGFFFGGAAGSGWDDWVEIFQPSYGKIKLCPLAKKTAKEGGKGIYAAWLDKEGEESGSYGLNGWVCRINAAEKDLYWGTPYVKNSKDVPVFLDCMSMVGWPDQSSIPPEYDGQPSSADTLPEQMKNFCINRHGKGETNCLFMNWSVRAVGLKQLWKLSWHKNFDTKGRWTLAGGVKPEDWPQWMRVFKDY
jgi:prepilin-type N-terminal cleavage/methylation domain-containing protein